MFRQWPSWCLGGGTLPAPLNPAAAQLPAPVTPIQRQIGYTASAVPRRLEQWQRTHKTHLGDIVVRVVESCVTGEWLISGSMRGSYCPKLEFDSLEAAQRYVDDWATGVFAAHDCKLSNCQRWQFEAVLSGDEPPLVQ